MISAIGGALAAIVAAGAIAARTLDMPGSADGLVRIGEIVVD